MQTADQVGTSSQLSLERRRLQSSVQKINMHSPIPWAAKRTLLIAPAFSFQLIIFQVKRVLCTQLQTLNEQTEASNKGQTRRRTAKRLDATA